MIGSCTLVPWFQSAWNSTSGERQSDGPHDTRLVAQPRRFYAQVYCGLIQAKARDCLPQRLQKQGLRCLGESSPDDDNGRIQQAHRGPDPVSKILQDLMEDAPSDGMLIGGKGENLLAFGLPSQGFCAAPRYGIAAGAGLEAAPLAASAGTSVSDHDGVADFARKIVRAAQQSAARDDSASDARADVYIKKVVEAAPRAEPPLAEGPGIGIIVQEHDPPEPVLHLITQVYAFPPGHMMAEQHNPPFVVHGPAETDADAIHLEALARGMFHESRDGPVCAESS
jgi:hypothetical protein